MKNLVFILCLTSLVLASCKKESAISLENRFLGKWNYVKVESVSEDGNPDNDEIFSPTPGNHAYVEFKSLGSVDNFHITEGEGEWHYDYEWKLMNGSEFSSTLFDDSYIIQKATFSNNDKHLVLYAEKTASGITYYVKYTLTRPYVGP